jgi:hypothetical protein
MGDRIGGTKPINNPVSRAIEYLAAQRQYSKAVSVFKQSKNASEKFGRLVKGIVKVIFAK